MPEGLASRVGTACAEFRVRIPVQIFFSGMKMTSPGFR